jgi:16S rRNA processing protein RimM
VEDENLVVLGHVSGVFGVKGWLKIHSETDPVQNIVKYDPWFIQKDKTWSKVKPLQGKLHGKGVIVQLDGYNDRDQAAELKGCEIAVRRDQLPAVADRDDFYWTDLEGLRVENLEGFYLGEISHLFETGSNDVMVINGDRERLVPYIWEQVVKKVDLDNGLMILDWDPDF